MTSAERSQPPVGELRLRLVLTCAAAALAHLFVLIYCDVTYVPPLLEPTPTSHVYLFSPSDPNPTFTHNVSLWLDLADPSRLIRPRHALLAAPRPVPLQPLPADREKGDELAASPSDPQLFPEGAADTRSTFWLPLPPVPSPANADLQATVPSESVAELDEALSRRLRSWWKPPTVSVQLLSETGPTVVRLAVDAQGFPCVVLLQESCGERKVDEIALREIQRLRFLPDSDAPLTWGRAKVFWHFREQGTP
ncbi:hypothetical protein [Methylacidimicrobium sp. B4]|uniref:hypothetical protein n=1 Tax=Methylacidimicrobium sp. B4 TaxID=2796139 RepID=UPI001A905976|nr:hypothetical protein [Methylacidimicrobium sp. B4]QSR84172.1 hypothetical protein MacB4_07970 [Methylacidimicrobium sp. B4]